MQKSAKLKNVSFYLLFNNFVEIINYCLDYRPSMDDPLENKIGIDLTVSATQKKLQKLYMFYIETFGIILNASSVKK